MAPPATLTLTPGVAPPVTTTLSPEAAPPMAVFSIPEVAPRATVVSSPSITVASHEDRSEPARLICPPTASITSTPSARSPSPTRSPPPQKFGSLKKLTLSDAQRQAFLVWDSDGSELTPLEDSLDEGESEIDPSESEDDVPETPTEPTPLRPLSIQDLTSPPPPKHRGICEIVRCMNLLSQDSRLRACNVCRHRKRAHRRQLGVAVALDEAEEVGMVLDMPADGDLTGYRKCGRTSCKRLIPPEATYRWKSCPPCRVKSRNRQRVTRAVPFDLPDDDDDYLLFAHTPTIAQDPSHSVVAKTVSTIATTPWPPHTLTNDFRTTLPSVPAYQHLAGLLDAFSVRFSEFTSAQKHYLRYKEDQQEGESPAKPRRDSIVFRFDGEYSIVADPSGGLVDALVQCVLRNVQAILGLTFTPIGVNAGPEESVIAILRCMYTTEVSLLDSPTEKATSDAGDKPNGDASQTLTVRMVGELQIYVAWDRRHKFFPGQRILVRFRLVG
ncbi:hypothetical protein BD413DRAFT_197250 [Trametes elegans]|nr:hypothetical protein BD413DRAFT_197250 [Trametes elegans]